MAELLIAAVCLGITAAGVLAALQFTDSQNYLARQRLLALSYASSEMERYRSKAYFGSITTGVTTTPIVNPALPAPAAMVTSVTTTPDPKVFAVGVQVNWTGQTSAGTRTRTIKLDSAFRNSDTP